MFHYRLETYCSGFNSFGKQNVRRRLCTSCDADACIECNVFEDENRVIFHCPLYEDVRGTLSDLFVTKCAQVFDRHFEVGEHEYITFLWVAPYCILYTPFQSVFLLLHHGKLL